MCAARYDREKTGPLAVTKSKTPSPDQYGVQAAQQALNVKIQPGNTRFGSEERKGPVQFLNKGPGPGQYGECAGSPFPLLVRSRRPDLNPPPVSGPTEALLMALNPCLRRFMFAPGLANMDKVCATTRMREAPKFSFGGQNVRNKAGMSKSSTPASVGPNSYNQGTGIGKQTISIRPTSPTWGLGSVSRAQVQKVCSPGYAPTPADNNPGPGNYALGSTNGPQVLSTSISMPSFGQGTSTRPNLNGKSTTPGPGLYKIPASIKTQFESRRPTTPSWGFGTSQRPSLDEGSAAITYLQRQASRACCPLKSCCDML